MYKLNWVPLPVLQKALIEKKHREISLFLFLKMTNSGRVKIKGCKKSEILQVLQIDETTLYRWIKELKEWDWVGYDSNTKTYFIRGFNHIHVIEGFKSRTAARIRMEDLFHIQSFSFSVCLGFLLRAQSRRNRRGAEQKTRSSKQSPATFYKPVAIKAMNKIFELSKDTLIKLKNLSLNAGYIKREKGYKRLYHVSKHSKEIYRVYPELWGRLRRDGSYIAIQGPDLFIDFHLYKRKKWR